MSKAITSSKEIYVGRILYHVYGCEHPEGSEIVPNEGSGYSKILVLSKPKLNDFDSYYFDAEVEYFDCQVKGSYKTKMFLGDSGIFDLKWDSYSRIPYNLNRLFGNKENALAFIEELQTGNFSDPYDAKVRGSERKNDFWLFCDDEDYV